MFRRLALALVIALITSISAIQPASAAPIDSKFGYDISWPQCGQVLPSDGAFRIIGINDGRPYYQNPCLVEQLGWAGVESAQLYLNTANPGPELSSFWPLDQQEPKVCNSADSDSTDCAFNYGFNYAKQALDMASLAYLQLGAELDVANTWIWLDVEEENTWRSDPTLNVASLRGAVHFLEKVAGAMKIGFYSVDSHWNSITGGTSAFSAYPSWLATASNPALSIEKCAERIGFTGGRLRLTQYIDPDLNLDVNVNCLDAPRLVTSFKGIRPELVKRSTAITLRAKLVSETGNPVLNKKVTFRYRGANYVTRTNSNGVARVSVKAPSRKGMYEFRVSFAGATYFAKVTSFKTLTVK